MLGFSLCFKQEKRYFISTYAFKAGFSENYFLKVVTRERIFGGSHMKPGQSLL